MHGNVQHFYIEVGALSLEGGDCMCGKGSVRKTGVAVFWRESPTPVIYRRNHKLTVIPENSRSTRTGGLAEMQLLWVQKSFSGKQSRGKMTLQERPKVQKPRRELRGRGAMGTLSGEVLSCKWAWRPLLYLTIEHRSRGGRTQQGEEVCEEEL